MILFTLCSARQNSTISRGYQTRQNTNSPEILPDDIEEIGEINVAVIAFHLHFQWQHTKLNLTLLCSAHSHASQHSARLDSFFQSSESKQTAFTTHSTLIWHISEKNWHHFIWIFANQNGFDHKKKSCYIDSWPGQMGQ